MFSISSNNIITIVKGDTGRLELKLNMGTPLNPNYYILQGYDEVYFHVVEPRGLFEDGVIQKKLTILDLPINVKRKESTEVVNINRLIEALPEASEITSEEAVTVELVASITAISGNGGLYSSISDDKRYFVNRTKFNTLIAAVLVAKPSLTGTIYTLDATTFNPYTETYTESTIYVDFEVVDTYDLDPGLYYYEVKLCKMNSYQELTDLKTVITRTRFYITL